MDFTNRFHWASSKLIFKPSAQLLEVGCGTGALASYVCKRMRSGSIIAIDRSDTFVSRARAMHSEQIDRGGLAFKKADFKDFSSRERYDIIFAFNVSAFWTKPWALVQAGRLLKPKGELAIFHQAPTPAQFLKINRLIPDYMVSRGWFLSETEVFELGPSPCAYYSFRQNVAGS